MNQIVISGRVSKAISVKGKVGYLTLANDRDYPFNKDKDGNKVSNFITIKIIGEKNVERAKQYLTQGTAIIVTGHYFRDTWKDGNDYKEFNFVQCEKWEWQLGKQNSGEESTPVEQPQEYVPDNTYTSASPSSPADGFIDVPVGIEGDLPFR